MKEYKKSPEVLIFLQKFKNFLENNDEASEYFLSNTDNEFFFTQLETIATKNFIKNGDPSLSMEQLELIRRTSTIVLGNKKDKYDLFLNMGEYGYFCLN